MRKREDIERCIDIDSGEYKKLLLLQLEILLDIREALQGKKAPKGG